MIDPMKEVYARMAAHLDRSETEAVTQALCKALGVKDCDPYKYFGRLSAQHRGPVRYVLLDGQDLIALHPVETKWAHDELICTMQTQYLWPDNKKPTV